MSPERVHPGILAQLDLQDAADELLSDEHREIMAEYEFRVDALFEEALEFYPDGVPDEVNDAIHDTVALELPRSREAIAAWLDIHSALLKNEKSGRIQ